MLISQIKIFFLSWELFRNNLVFRTLNISFQHDEIVSYKIDRAT